MKECKKIMGFDWDAVVENNAKNLAEQNFDKTIKALENEIKEKNEMLKDIITGSITYNKIKKEIKGLKEKQEELKKEKNKIIENYENWDWENAEYFTKEDWEFFIDELSREINDGGLWLVDGSAGTWRGRVDYGMQYVGTFKDFLNKATDGDIEVEVFDCEKYKKIEVKISHHDGTNYYEIIDDIKEYLKDIEYYDNISNKDLGWIISEFIKYREDIFINKLLKKIKKSELVKIYEDYYEDCENCNKKQTKKELFEDLFDWAEDESLYYLIVDFNKFNDFIEILLNFDEDTFFDYILTILEN